MKTLRFVLILVTVALLMSALPSQEKIDPKELTPEKVFRVKPYFGKSARGLEFSESARYLAYLWSPIDENGYDLYVYQVSGGKTVRVTSLEIMKKYDTPEDYEEFIKKAKQKQEEDEELQKQYDAQKDFLEGKDVDLSVFEKEGIEKVRKEFEEKKKKEEAEKKEKLEEEKKGEKKDSEENKKEKKEQEKEEWEWRDEWLKKKEKEKIKWTDLYPGVSRFVWSKKGDELIFEYRGDLYRYHPDRNSTRRLTMTDENERIISYTSAGDGYLYQKEDKVFLVRFQSSLVRQINHELSKEEKYKIERTSVSPDGKWMAIVASKQEGKPAMRDVDYISYKERFADAKKTKRQVTDDKRNEPEYRFIIRRVPDGDNFGKEPKPVFTIPGGDVWHEFSAIVWNEQGSGYAFTTWEREKGLLRVYYGRASETDQPLIIYKNEGNVGHEVVSTIDPKFTPDGKNVVVILDEKEFRQPYAIDILTHNCRPLIEGDFVSLPVIGFSPDSRYMYVVSSKEDPAMNSVYRVPMKGGKMERLGREGGKYRGAVISKNGRWLAGVFANWRNPGELYLSEVSSRRERRLTESHDPEWKQIQVLVPELFKYKNRHGDMVSALAFKPEGWKPQDKRPAIVYVYGGPLGLGHTVEVDSFNTSTYLFNMYMAAKYGFVTFAVDPRGQSGYGRRFGDANWEQSGKPQVEDLEDLVKYIGDNYGVDAGRVGLHGWSFGGFQTQMTLYTSPDTFACGIAGAGPTEWENYNSWYSGRTIGPSVRQKPTLRKYSLLPLARNLKNPLLLIHGMEDTNVLYQDTVKVYQALLEAGKETLVELFLDPQGGHGLGGIVFTKARFKKYEEFFLRHLEK